MIPRIPVGHVPMSSFRFQDGLDVHIGDSAWLLPSGLATNMNPNGGRIKGWLVKHGVIRTKLAMHLGTIVSTTNYRTHGTCTVILM